MVSELKASIATASKLEACPFGCGTEELGFSCRQGQSTKYVICWKCEAEGPAADNDFEAAKLWNTRAAQSLSNTGSDELARRIELQRTAAPEDRYEDGWNAGLDRAATMVREANAIATPDTGRLGRLLSDLHALVWSECPSLLNEDSGGDDKLDAEIRAAIAGRSRSPIPGGRKAVQPEGH